MKARFVSFLLTCAVAAPGIAAGAEESWRALVVGQPAPGAETAFADSYHVAEALRGAGLAQVDLYRDVSGAAIDAAIARFSGVDRVLVYYAGPLAADGHAMTLKNGAKLEFETLLGRLNAGGTRQVVLAIEDCAGTGGTGLALPPSGSGQLLMAASAGPGGACPPPGERLTDKLTAAARSVDGYPLDEILAGAWQRSTLAQPPVLRVATAPPTLPPAAIAAQPATVVARDVVAISPTVSPVRASSQVVPVAAAALDRRQPGTPGARDAVVIFTAPPQSQVAAIPAAAGLPEPSIIVGIIPGSSSAFERVKPPGGVTSTEVSYDNLDARRAMKAQDPGLYANLVNGGAFDPPAAAVAGALQTELARMGCYTAGIDGAWGNGSRAAAQLYFAQRPGVQPASFDASVDLFRQIILADDVACPAPQPVARTATGGGAPAAAAPATPAPTRAPEATPAIGVFR